MWRCGGDKSFQFSQKKDVKLIASNNAVVIMIPSFGVSSSQATVKEGKERDRRDLTLHSVSLSSGLL